VKLPAVDIAVLLVYLAGVVGFGCWFVRRSRNTEGFVAAGRSLPGWAVGLSIFGTYLSSNTFIGLTGKTFGTNWNPFVFSLSLPIAAVIAGLRSHRHLAVRLLPPPGQYRQARHATGGQDLALRAPVVR